MSGGFLEEAVRHEERLPFVSVDLAGRRLLLAVPNHKCLGFARSLASREPMTVRWIHAFRPGDTLFDVGANNGIYSLLAAAVADCRAVAFEPHFASYFVLCRNVYANKLQDRVAAYPLALSDGDGFGRIFLSAITAGKSLNQYGEAHPSDDPLWNATIPQGCATTTLDRFAALSGERPTHVKIDVDGLEDRVVAGARGLLADEGLLSVLVETTGKEDRDRAVAATIEGAGLVRVAEEGGNTIWARPSFAAALAS